MGRGQDNGRVNVHCPDCGRWLAETTGHVRVVCPKCGCQVEITLRIARHLTNPKLPATV